jgi:nucleoside phosphorylase
MALTHEDYTVAWICALPLEMAAAKLMLETTHPTLPQPQTDHNVYTLGSISGHNIVIACLPSGVYGTTSAAIVLDQMQPTFPRLRFGLMVGVGGGVPSPSGKADIRLGDVVVSMPTSGSTVGGVIQYDYGKTLHDGSFWQTGSLNKPPRYLLTAISQMRSDDLLGDISSRIAELISDILDTRKPKVRDEFARPDHDWLFKPSYHHYRSEDRDCSACDETQLEVREPRDSKKPLIHYGLIASGNQVLKDPMRRDALAGEMGILCFEMEAAGLMDQLSCLVIRGISDYCDSHKHKNWQGYAALTAAAYAKALLDVVPSENRKEPTQQGWVPPSPSNLERIKEILQPSIYPLDSFQSIGKRRVPGTGDWVRNEPLFRAWLEKYNSPLLWVTGTPGCGKSFIAQNVIAYLQERFPQCDAAQGSRTSIGFFFFRHNHPETRRFHRALRDIAFQIYQNDPSYRDYLHTHCHSTGDIKSIHAAWRVLFMVYHCNAYAKVDGNVIFVLDGVDEALEEDCREFFGLVSDTVHGELLGTRSWRCGKQFNRSH